MCKMGVREREIQIVTGQKCSDEKDGLLMVPQSPEGSYSGLLGFDPTQPTIGDGTGQQVAVVQHPSKGKLCP